MEAFAFVIVNFFSEGKLQKKNAKYRDLYWKKKKNTFYLKTEIYLRILSNPGFMCFGIFRIRCCSLVSDFDTPTAHTYRT